jgi:hypothetical protein
MRRWGPEVDLSARQVELVLVEWEMRSPFERYAYALALSPQAFADAFPDEASSYPDLRGEILERALKLPPTADARAILDVSMRYHDPSNALAGASTVPRMLLLVTAAVGLGFLAWWFASQPAA